MSINKIGIEKYLSIEEDGIDLWEITDLDIIDLCELEDHLTLSAYNPSSRFTIFLKDLRYLISSLDKDKAS